jgi:sugar/nucleoside kinase (ribokinase family)
LIFKAGFDFPSALLERFTSWNVDVRVLECPDQPAARGRVLYGVHASDRTFERVTSPLLTTPQDLLGTGLLVAKCLHFFDTATTVSAQIDEINQLRASEGIDERLLVVWEPQAKSCSPETFQEHKQLVASGKVQVFSPNHVELAMLCSSPDQTEVTEFNKATVEVHARTFLPAYDYDNARTVCCILIRCAEYGCFVLWVTSGGQHSTWLPPFYGSGESHRIVDPTGAGNTFLGGLAMGLLETGDFVQAAKYGSVAASFAVEVVGLPDVETCDGTKRLKEFEARLEGRVTYI